MLISAKRSTLLGGLCLALSTSANALWDCGYDQHVYPIDLNKFVVHFTSARDSNYNTAQPWIRICTPNDDGTWSNVDPIGLSCAPKGDTFGPDTTTLDADLRVIGGDGCNAIDGASGGLDGATITYKDQSINLQYAGDACGPRDHGITCQFDK